MFDLAAFFNSNLGVALIGGFFGSAGGALGAQYITTRVLRHKEVLQDLKYLNAATLLSIQIANSALRLKNQHTQPLIKNYEQQFSDYSSGKPVAQLRDEDAWSFQLDFMTTPPFNAPIERLEEIVISKVFLSGREISAVSELAAAIEGYKEAVSNRLKAIQTLQSIGIPTQQLAKYFGIPEEDGTTDITYKTSVECIHEYVNDIIFFSVALSTDISKKAATLIHQESGIFSCSNAPHIVRPNWQAVKLNGLVPDDSKYPRWLAQFKTP